MSTNVVALHGPVDLRSVRSPIRLRALVADELDRIIAGFDTDAGLLALASGTRAELVDLRDRLAGAS